MHQEHVGLLEGCNVVLLYDEDAAGYKRRDQWKDLLQDVVGAIKVVKLPGVEYRKNSGADVSDCLKGCRNTDELLELVQQTADFDFTHPESSKGQNALNIQEFLSVEIPERKMILDPIIPSQGLSLLYSKRGVGKTFLSLAIGYAVASDVSFLRWKSIAPVKVLYVDGKMPAHLMQERKDKLVRALGSICTTHPTSVL